MMGSFSAKYSEFLGKYRPGVQSGHRNGSPDRYKEPDEILTPSGKPTEVLAGILFRGTIRFYLISAALEYSEAALPVLSHGDFMDQVGQFIYRLEKALKTEEISCGVLYCVDFPGELFAVLKKELSIPVRALDPPRALLFNLIHEDSDPGRDILLYFDRSFSIGSYIAPRQGTAWDPGIVLPVHDASAMIVGRGHIVSPAWPQGSLGSEVQTALSLITNEGRQRFISGFRRNEAANVKAMEDISALLAAAAVNLLLAHPAATLHIASPLSAAGPRFPEMIRDALRRLYLPLDAGALLSRLEMRLDHETMLIRGSGGLAHMYEFLEADS